MPQGAPKRRAKKEKKRAKPYATKKKSTANTRVGKGNIGTGKKRAPTTFYKMRGKQNQKMERAVTGKIHQNIEAVMAGKAVQNGTRFHCPDLFKTGKDKWKEVKVNALKKKTPVTKFKERVQKKLAKLAKEGKETE